MEEPPTKKVKVSYNHSNESKEKDKNKKKETRKVKNMFIQMLNNEFPESKITNKDLKIFLFKLGGYDFDPGTFQITQRPSKFGGVWKQVQQPVGKSINQYKSSLLMNKRLIELIHQPLCDQCGAIWNCKLAEGTQVQKNTNGIFHLSCPSCGFYKYWTTQGDDSFLDDLLWISCRLTGTSPTKLGHILRLIDTGYNDGQHCSGELFREKIVPTIDQQYLEVHEKVFKEVKKVCEEKKIGAIITWDGGYASRNNNSDHAVVDFVEHVTGKNLLLHLEMSSCSKELMPQAAEKELIIRGYKHIKSQLPVSRVGHDGKEVKNVKEIDPTVADDLDPWHFKKLELKHFKEDCTEATKCIRGNKKLSIPGDSKTVQQLKMMRRKNLLRLKQSLGFHLIRCLKCCKKSEDVFWMLWSGYLLHCIGDHRCCVDEQKGLSSLGKSICALKKKPAHLYDGEKIKILQNYLFNSRIEKELPRLVYFTASSPNESIWNVMGIYRDKNLHYKYYDVFYKMGYLDWNENRQRKVRYIHKTSVRDWKIRHPKRYNRSILEDKNLQLAI